MFVTGDGSLTVPFAPFFFEKCAAAEDRPVACGIVPAASLQQSHQWLECNLFS